MSNATSPSVAAVDGVVLVLTGRGLSAVTARDRSFGLRARPPAAALTPLLASLFEPLLDRPFELNALRVGSRAQPRRRASDGSTEQARRAGSQAARQPTSARAAAPRT